MFINCYLFHSIKKMIQDYEKNDGYQYNPKSSSKLTDDELMELVKKRLSDDQILELAKEIQKKHRLEKKQRDEQAHQKYKEKQKQDVILQQRKQYIPDDRECSQKCYNSRIHGWCIHTAHN